MAARTRITRGRLATAAIGIAIVATTFGIAAPSQASFPGTNGLIAYVSAGNVFVVNAANPVPTQVTNTGNFTKVGYNAGGNRLAASNNAGIVLLDPVAGSAVTVVPNTVGGDSNPAFSPDGTKLAFNNPAFQIGTIDIPAGTNKTIINTGPGFAAQPDFSADGTFIAFAQPNAVSRAAVPGGNVTVIVTAAGLCPTPNSCSPTVSPSNAQVIFANQNAGGGLRRVNSNGTTVTPEVITNNAADGFPSYSPDGTQVAFSRAGVLNRAPSDGSATATAIGAIGGVTDTSWGKTVSAPGTITFSVTGPVGKVKNGACVFTVSASGAVTGSVSFTAAVVSGKNTPSPASGTLTFANQTSQSLSIDVKHSRRKHGDVSVTLTSATGGAVGVPSSATCDVGKK